MRNKSPVWLPILVFEKNRVLSLQRDDTKGQNIKTEEDCCSEAVLNLNSLITLLKMPYMLQDESLKPRQTSCAGARLPRDAPGDPSILHTPPGFMPLMARGYAFPYHPTLARRQDCGAVSVSATPAAGPVHRVARSGHLHPASGDGGLHHLGPSGRKTSFVGGSQETRRRQRRLVVCAWSPSGTTV